MLPPTQKCTKLHYRALIGPPQSRNPPSPRPPIEKPIIEDVARRAAKQSQSVSNTYRGERDVIVLETAPVIVSGTVQGSAWVMKRLPGLRSERDLKISAGFAGFVLLSLISVLLAFFVARDLGAGVTRIEDRLPSLIRTMALRPRISTALRSWLGCTEG
jgi:hypothetical protein